MTLHSHLARHGKSATVTNFSESGTDSYGDPTFTESTQSTEVIIERLGEVQDVISNPSGQEIIADAYIYVDDEVDIRAGVGGEYPSEITVDSIDYEVQIVDSYDNGIVKTVCKRL